MEHLVKISRPSPSGVFPRHRLFRLLDQKHAGPIVWITGPPGSGKTALVSSYLNVRKLPCLWYQVDEGDADIASFFYYMGLAAKKAVPRKRTPLPLLTTEYLQDIPAFTRHFFENLCRRLPNGSTNRGTSPPALRVPASPTRFVIVLDNYQEVPEESLFHEVVQEGLSRVPEEINVILISRRDPPDVFARMMANRLIGMIGWKELKFTPDESRRMIRLSGLKRAQVEVLKNLHERTDGWAAGMVLLIEGMKAKIDGLISPEGPMSEDLFHYFAKEVLNRSDPEVQKFLLKTSFLPQMSSEMARTFTGIQRSQDILSDLTRKNYFTQKHESKISVYQYHPLFREFLQSLAKQTMDSTTLSSFKREAAGILESNGQIEDAMDLLMTERAWPNVVPLILKYAPALLASGRHRALERWLGCMPAEVLAGVPWLLYSAGMCRLPFSPPESRHFLEQAFQKFRARRDAVGTFLTLSGLFDTITFEASSYKPFDRTSELFEEALQQFGSFPSLEIEARLAASMLPPMAFRQPHRPDFEARVARALELLEHIPDLVTKLQILIAVAGHRLFAGELAKAESLLDSFRALARSPDVPPLLWIVLKDLEAFYYWLTGAFEENRKVVTEGLDLSSATGIRLLEVYLLGHGAAGALSSGDPAGAKVFLKEMASYLPRVGSWPKAFYYTLSAWAALIKGNLSKALSDSESGSKFAIEAGQSQTQVYSDIVGAIILHELKRYREADMHILKSRNLARSARVPIAEFTCLLAEARFAFDKGKDRSGMTCLQRALSLGEEKGYVNTYFWQPAVMANLCKKALEAGIEVKYVRALIQKRQLMPDPPPYDCVDWPWLLKINTLGRFDLLKDGEPVRFRVRAPRKVLTLLKALISFGRNGASGEQLMDALWPDADGDMAQKALDTTLHRLRQLLGHEKLIQVREGHVQLDPRYCMVDAHALEELLDRAETAKSFDFVEKAIALYQGRYLLGDLGEPWAVSYRERLRSKFLRSVRKFGNQFEKKGQSEKAIDYYQKALEVDGVAEELYQRLMVCYHSRGRKAEALAAYDRCRNMFQSVFGIEPSPKTRTIYEEIRRNQ